MSGNTNPTTVPAGDGNNMVKSLVEVNREMQPGECPPLVDWLGPNGACHHLAPDFFDRCRAWIMEHHRRFLTDDDYVKYPRGGKVLRIPLALLPEFLRSVDCSRGLPHVYIEQGQGPAPWYAYR